MCVGSGWREDQEPSRNSRLIPCPSIWSYLLSSGPYLLGTTVRKRFFSAAGMLILTAECVMWFGFFRLPKTFSLGDS